MQNASANRGNDNAQADLVLPLRDPTSDMAVISRNGSQLVRAACSWTYQAGHVQLNAHDIALNTIASACSHTAGQHRGQPCRCPCISSQSLIVPAHQVKEVREKKEAGKSRARFWEVAGSKMGKITGIVEATVLARRRLLVLGAKRRGDACQMIYT